MSDYGGRRHSRAPAPEYVETEETFIHRGSGSGARDLVVRTRDRDDDYDYDDRRRSSYRDDRDYAPRRARSSHYHGRDYDDGYYDDYDRSSRRRSRYDDDYSYYSDDDRERGPRRERRKSKITELAEGLGLGAAATAITDKLRSRSQSRPRRSSGGGYYSDDDRRRSRSRSGAGGKKWKQAATAAAVAAAVAAFQNRNQPGPWTGEKGSRIATAALASAGIDGFLDRDPDRKSKRHILESVVGGTLVNRAVNGPSDAASDSRGRGRSRSRSVVDRLRSRSRSIFGGRDSSRARSDSRGRARSQSRGLKEVAGLGIAAAAGKAIYDRVRSKSRGRLRRDASASSDDSYVPSRRQRYQPREPPSRGLEAGEAGDDTNDRGRAEERSGGDTAIDRKRDGSSDSSSSQDTDDLKESYRKTRTKELLTAALASVATIHATHGLYSSMVASERRHKKVVEGEMSPETARKLKSKNVLQDVAAVGIAAMSIKSAFAEWKEMTEQRKEKHEIFSRRRKRIKAREKREREQERQFKLREREMRLQGQYVPPQGQGYYGGGAAGDYYRNSQDGRPSYGDANPYGSYGGPGSGAGGIPPPPVGPAPPNRYP